MASESSPEYRTLIKLTDDIEVALRDSLVEIGSKLVASELITPIQARNIRNPNNPAELRAAELVGYIQTKVQQNPKHYGTFIDVLKEDQVQYDDILKKLKKMYDSLRRGVGPARGGGGGQAVPAVKPNPGGMLQSVLDSVVWLNLSDL